MRPVLLYLFVNPIFSLASLHLKERMHELTGGLLLVEHQGLLPGPDPALLMLHQDMVDEFSR